MGKLTRTPKLPCSLKKSSEGRGEEYRKNSKITRMYKQEIRQFSTLLLELVRYLVLLYFFCVVDVARCRVFGYCVDSKRMDRWRGRDVRSFSQKVFHVVKSSTRYWLCCSLKVLSFFYVRVCVCMLCSFVHTKSSFFYRICAQLYIKQELLSILALQTRQ